MRRDRGHPYRFMLAFGVGTVALGHVFAGEAVGRSVADLVVAGLMAAWAARLVVR